MVVPILGKHRSNGLLYIWEIHPVTDEHAWLRYDTFVRGEWRKYPFKTTATRMLDPYTPWPASWRARRLFSSTPVGFLRRRRVS